MGLGGGLNNQHGSVPVELAVSLMLFLFIAFGVVEYGSMINERNALTQLAREGASLASRDLTTDQNMLDLLESTDNALKFKGNKGNYRIFLARIQAGVNANNPDPTCSVVARGTLGGKEIRSPIADPDQQCELPAKLWTYVTYNDGIQAAPVERFTLVKVYYKHEPLTPFGRLTWFGGGGKNNGTIMSSRAIF